jgi:dihydroxyacetone kinase-like protein
MLCPRPPTTQLKPKIRVTGPVIDRWMRLFAAEIGRSVGLLTELDRAIGDGDHGVNIDRGMRSVVTKLDELRPPDLAGRLRTISIALTSSVGGASGPLYGAFFLQAAPATVCLTELSLTDLTHLTEVGYQGVVKLGRADVGDKTMVDTFHAAVRSLRVSCQRREALPEALATCAHAARLAARDTIPMLARKGRASYLGPRSIGHQDPGATSAHLLFDSLARALSPSKLPNPRGDIP